MERVNNVPLTKQLDELLKVKLEYQRKVFHKIRIAKMEKDATETEKQICELHRAYLVRIVDRL